MNKIYLFLVVVAMLIFTSCDKQDPEEIFGEPPTLNIPDLSYVAFTNPWTYNDPESFLTDIYAGFDDHVYVVDSGREEVIVYNQGLDQLEGRVLSVPGARKVAQNLRYELFVLGTTEVDAFDTTYTLDAIYIYSFDINNYDITAFIPIDTIIHPFWDGTLFGNPGRAEYFQASKSHFTDISFLSDNSFYLTINADKDIEDLNGTRDNFKDGVLYFNKRREFQRRITVELGSGARTDQFFIDPVGITTFLRPVSANGTPDDSPDFIVIVNDVQRLNKALYIEQFEGDQEEILYRQNLYPIPEEGNSLQTLNLFDNPSAIGISASPLYLYITDKSSDSLFQFSNPNSPNGGQEGIVPITESEEEFVSVSFGGTGITAKEFNNPVGVAWSNEILFVVDQGNNRISKFKLTTDFDN